MNIQMTNSFQIAEKVIDGDFSDDEVITRTYEAIGVRPVIDTLFEKFPKETKQKIIEGYDGATAFEALIKENVDVRSEFLDSLIKEEIEYNRDSF